MNEVENEVIEVVRGVLAGRGHSGVELNADSGLNSPTAWDSLAFVEIFMAVAQHFSLDVSDDDAIYFMTVREIADFIREHR